MAVANATTEIGIVLYPGAQMAAVHGLTDLFCIADRFSAAAQPDGRPSLRVTHWAPAGPGQTLACTFSSEPGVVPQPSTLILPPTLMELPEPGVRARIERWLLDHHRRGVGLVAICSGVFLVAGTGLLDGRMVSTHHSCARALMDDFPGIAVVADERMIEHPDVLTAGGFMAWVDVGLVLVERLLGAAVRAETEGFVLPQHRAGESPAPERFAPPWAHSDAAVLKAQELVHLRDGRGLSLDDMAAAARLERRTFIRRFSRATGRTPLEYCRVVRISRACELLHGGNMSLKQISEVLGYADAATFARAFREVQGMPPGTFRKQRERAVA
jgi:transcriptional regulator GlxA family with amidase domain